MSSSKKFCLPHTSIAQHYTQFQMGLGIWLFMCYEYSMLYVSHARFVVKVKEQLVGRVSSELSGLLWPLTATNMGWPRCSQYFDEAYAFAVEGSPSDEWYFSLHVSTFLPLYSLLAMRRHLGPAPGPAYSVVLLPAVEDYSLSVCFSTYSSDSVVQHIPYCFQYSRHMQTLQALHMQMPIYSNSYM